MRYFDENSIFENPSQFRKFMKLYLRGVNLDNYEDFKDFVQEGYLFYLTFLDGRKCRYRTISRLANKARYENLKKLGYFFRRESGKISFRKRYILENKKEGNSYGEILNY